MSGLVYVVKLEGKVEQRNVKTIVFPVEQVLKNFGLDPETHYIEKVEGTGGMCHHQNISQPMITISLREIEPRKER